MKEQNRFVLMSGMGTSVLAVILLQVECHVVEVEEGGKK